MGPDFGIDAGKFTDVDTLTGQIICITGVADAHTAEHLANDDLEVLVIDAYALGAVHLLGFLEHIGLQGVAPLDFEQFLGMGRPFGQELTSDHTAAVTDFFAEAGVLGNGSIDGILIITDNVDDATLFEPNSILLNAKNVISPAEIE